MTAEMVSLNIIRGFFLAIICAVQKHKKLYFRRLCSSRPKRAKWILLSPLSTEAKTFGLRMACILAQDFVTLNDVPMYVKHTSILYIYGMNAPLHDDTGP